MTKRIVQAHQVWVLIRPSLPAKEWAQARKKRLAVFIDEQVPRAFGVARRYLVSRGATQGYPSQQIGLLVSLAVKNHNRRPLRSSSHHRHPV